MTRSIYQGGVRVDLTVRDGVSSPVGGAAVARAIAAAAEAAGAPIPCVIGLILSNNSELAELNAAHLDKLGPTDVLSFPLLPADTFPPHPGRLEAPARGPSFVLPPGRRPHLGDVVLSVERAVEQARDGRGGQTGDVQWAVAAELLLLVTHGTLHLCGWDHAEPVEEAAMRALERRLLGPAN